MRENVFHLQTPHKVDNLFVSPNLRVCVCVCEREREREREDTDCASGSKTFQYGRSIARDTKMGVRWVRDRISYHECKDG